MNTYNRNPDSSVDLRQLLRFDADNGQSAAGSDGGGAPSSLLGRLSDDVRRLSALMDQDPDAGGESMALDRVLELLRNERRRRVVRLLDDAGELTTSELSDRIAAIEVDSDRATVDGKQRKRVYVSLYQTHIPAFVDAGVVAKERGRVRATGRLAILARALEQIEGLAGVEPEGDDGL